MITALSAIVCTTALSAGLFVGDGTHRAAALLVAVLLLAHHGAKCRADVGSASSPVRASLLRGPYLELRRDPASSGQPRSDRRPRTPRGVSQ